MIEAKNYSSEWFESKKKEFPGKDPILIEKVMRALTLLELLTLNELNFIFKGGTSLILLLQEAHRFSIDIDIITEISDTAHLLAIFDKVIESGRFTHYEEHPRKVSGIPKAHYKFYYSSLVQTQFASYILLDILFEENPYEATSKVPIQSRFIETAAPITHVTVPTIECILGDKLTAFAPNTTGIPYEKGKELEIIKQLFDVSNLFDVAVGMDPISQSFHSVAHKEIEYRQLQISSADVLDDIFQTSLKLSLMKYEPERNHDANQKELWGGIRKLKGYIYSKSFTIDNAILCAAKAAYLALVLKYRVEPERYNTDNLDVTPLQIVGEAAKLNRLKTTNKEAFYYWYKAIELIPQPTSKGTASV